MAEELIGTVTHYFGRPGVGVVQLTGSIKAGDHIRITGHTTHFEQVVTSMEVEHGKIESAVAGDEIAIKVDHQVREHDQVFLITED
jgi:putative protease